MEFLSLMVVCLIAALAAVSLLISRRASPPKSPCKPPLIKLTPNKKVNTKATGKRYLVVGGSGFLGSHIVEALLARGEEHIRIFDQHNTPLFQNHRFVEFMVGNIVNQDDCRLAAKDIDVVFHAAALVDYWSRFAFQRLPSYAVNVTGTENIINACIEEGVEKLIFTSSSNVILPYWQSVRNGDETWPYPQKPNNHYTETKGLAEKAVLAANGKNGLMTCAVRPNGIFGPRDNLMAEPLWRTGKPDPMISKGNIQDWVYVENVVHAQLLLESKLSNPSNTPAGRTYGITGDRPMEYIEFWTNLNRAVGGKDEDIVVAPKILVWTLAYTSEILTWIFRGKLKAQFFKLTPAVLSIATADLFLDSSKAKADWGYEPPYTMEEAFQQCKNYYCAEK